MTAHTLKDLPREELEAFVGENVNALAEDEAIAALENPWCGAKVCGAIARNQRLIGYYSVRALLVAHRQTPQAHAVKLVHYLYWFDLLRLSVDVRVAAPVRRAIETQLLLRVDKLTTGEKVTSARQCGPALVDALIHEPHPQVFAALLINKRLREDDLLALINSRRATPEQLQMIAEDARWSFRRAIRLALVLNPDTPRAAAASQLRHLSRRDLTRIHANPGTTVYLRRCIERMR